MGFASGARLGPYEVLDLHWRAVQDAASATGYSVEVGPFPGWKDVPTWQRASATIRSGWRR